MVRKIFRIFENVALASQLPKEVSWGGRKAIASCSFAGYAKLNEIQNTKKKAEKSVKVGIMGGAIGVVSLYTSQDVGIPTVPPTQQETLAIETMAQQVPMIKGLHYSIPVEAVNATEVQAEVVNTEGMQVEAVNATEVQAEVVNTEEMQAEAVNVTEVQIEVVNTEEMQAEAVNATEVQAEVVNTEEMQAEAVNVTEVQIEVVNTEEMQAEAVNATEVQAEVANTAEIQIGTPYYKPTAEELDFLYKLVYAEAGNQAPFHQTIAANVIINRAIASGNNILKVGRKSGQFSSVKNGVPCIYVKTEDKWIPVTQKMISPDLKMAVEISLEKDFSEELLRKVAEDKGINDPQYWQGGALFFYNPEACKEKALNDRKYIKVKAKVGDHYIYRVWDKK